MNLEIILKMTFRIAPLTERRKTEYAFGYADDGGVGLWDGGMGAGSVRIAVGLIEL